MGNKNFFVLSIFFVFLISFGFSATVTNTDSVTPSVDYTQSFAQINARLLDLTNQINAMKTQDLNAQMNSVQKSDLPIIYENVTRSVQAVEQQIVLDNIIIVVLAFAIMFLLIGKGMIPQNNKPKSEESKKIVAEEDLILKPEENGVI